MITFLLGIIALLLLIAVVKIHRLCLAIEDFIHFRKEQLEEKIPITPYAVSQVKKKPTKVGKTKRPAQVIDMDDPLDIDLGDED